MPAFRTGVLFDDVPAQFTWPPNDGDVITWNGGIKSFDNAKPVTGPAAIQTPFAWGDASPSPVVIVPAGRVVLECRLAIVVPFNGVAPSLRVGTMAFPSLFMDSPQNDPATVAEYATYPSMKFVTATAVFLFIVPGAGASAGSGLVVLSYQS